MSAVPSPALATSRRRLTRRERPLDDVSHLRPRKLPVERASHLLGWIGSGHCDNCGAPWCRPVAVIDFYAERRATMNRAAFWEMVRRAFWCRDCVVARRVLAVALRKLGARNGTTNGR